MSFALDINAISSALGQASRRFDIDLIPQCESTNSLLLARAEVGAPSGTVLISEHQTAGRGRRGRAWISAPGDSLTFSVLWRFSPGIVPAGLSLAAGLAVAMALARLGVGGTAGDATVQLKWPNDILQSGRKLGGILIELQPGASHAAVIGIGLNLRLPAAMPEDIRLTAAALPPGINANELMAAVLAALLSVLERFSFSGFSSLREEWLRLHAFQDAPVCLLSDFDPPREGVSRGVDVDGALLFESAGRVERVLSGEVSVRSVA